MNFAELYRQFDIIDARARMHRADWTISHRVGNPTSVTLHYDGAGAVARGRQLEIAHLYQDSLWHTRPGAFEVASGGDGIMYHFAVLSDGAIVQLRDITAVLWHCGNTNANRYSLAVQLPLGIGQPPTQYQWDRFCSFSLGLVAVYGMPGGRDAIRAHREWPRTNGTAQSTCPGDLLFQRLLAFRAAAAQPATPGDVRYRVKQGIDFAAIRTGPSTSFPRALNNTAKANPGDSVLIDSLHADARTPRGPARWAHLSRNDVRRDLGFISLDLLEKLS